MKLIAILIIFSLLPFRMAAADNVDSTTLSITEEKVALTCELEVPITLCEGEETDISEPIEEIESFIVDDLEEPDISESELYALALVTLAEAEGESELGKRLVIDTVLNRVDSSKFPDDILSVVWEENQFSGMDPARLSRVVLTDDIFSIVREEVESRTNSEVLYFRAGYYHSFGTPIVSEGNHYFSGE